MDVTEFDFPLPDELIARQPLAERDSSRLMVAGHEGEIRHSRFTNLPEFLNSGDMLLMNNTKVLPCRLRGIKRSGNPLEILLVKCIEGRTWEILSAGGYTGPLEISPSIRADIHKGLTAELHYTGELNQVLWAEGLMPLPPYLKRAAHAKDRDWYQTVYAEHEGSIAAPTAGLHITDEQIEQYLGE